MRNKIWAIALSAVALVTIACKAGGPNPDTPIPRNPDNENWIVISQDGCNNSRRCKLTVQNEQSLTTKHVTIASSTLYQTCSPGRVYIGANAECR